MDSFELWGASLCWAEDAQANILSTQDIMDHEASLDCAQRPPSQELQGTPASSQAPTVDEGPPVRESDENLDSSRWGFDVWASPIVLSLRC